MIPFMSYSIVYGLLLIAYKELIDIIVLYIKASQAGQTLEGLAIFFSHPHGDIEKMNAHLMELVLILPTVFIDAVANLGLAVSPIRKPSIALKIAWSFSVRVHPLQNQPHNKWTIVCTRPSFPSESLHGPARGSQVPSIPVPRRTENSPPKIGDHTCWPVHFRCGLE